MAKLTPQSFFAYYHLGYDEKWDYKFRNINDASRYFGCTADDLEEFMQEHQLHPDVFPRVDFNLSVAHADGQILSVIGSSQEEIQAFVRTTFESFSEALKSYDGSHVFEDIDWDDPFGFGGESGE